MNKGTAYARRDVGNVLVEMLSRHNVELSIVQCCASLYTVFNGFGPELCLQYSKRLAKIVLDSSELRSYEHHNRISERFVELYILKAVRNCLLDTPISVSYTLSLSPPEKESSDAVEARELSTETIAEHSEGNVTWETTEPSRSDSDEESGYDETIPESEER